MDEYIIKQIKENKIINNALCSLLIHEIHYFEYEKEEYAFYYISSPFELENVYLNDIKPLMIKKEQDGIYFVLYKTSDLSDDIRITSYKAKEKQEVTINEFIPIDYDDYDLNENNLKILRQLKLIGLKEYLVLPKVKDEYWICSCGKCNTKDRCEICETKKSFAALYSSEKDIQQSFIKDEFRRLSFNGEDEEEQISKFKDRILKNKKYTIKEEYLTDSLFKSLDNESKEHIKEYKYKSSKSKQISKNIKIFLLIIAVIVIIAIILSNINNKKDNSKNISKYCSNSEYKELSKLDDVIKNYSCGSLIYYISKHNIDESDMIKLINSDNEEIYKTFYKYNKKNLHDEIKETYIKSKAYIQYLIDNDYNLSDELLNYSLNTAMDNDDIDLFTMYMKFEDKSKDGWTTAYRYLDYGCTAKDEKISTNLDKLKENVKYAAIYHENSNRNKCFVADLYSVDNMKKLFSIKDNKTCQYNMSNNINNPSFLKNYISAGGSFEYSSYLGNFYHHLLKNYISDETISNYKEVLKLLFANDKGINDKMKKDDAYPEYTPLDMFLSKNVDNCKDAKSSVFNSAYKTKSCNISSEIYKMLKNKGAKCNKLCDKEQYFK